MKKVVKRGRPVGSKNKPKAKSYTMSFTIKKKTQSERIAELERALDHAGQVSDQARDQIADLLSQVEFYRKQVNHFLALLNILAKGA